VSQPHVLLVHYLFLAQRGPGGEIDCIKYGFSEKTLKALQERYADRRLVVVVPQTGAFSQTGAFFEKFQAELAAHDVCFMQWDTSHVVDSLAKLVDVLREHAVVVHIPPGRNVAYMHIDQHVTFGQVTWIGRHDHEVHGIPLDKELTVKEMQTARASSARW